MSQHLLRHGGHLHADESTVDGIPADEADLHTRPSNDESDRLQTSYGRQHRFPGSQHQNPNGDSAHLRHHNHVNHPMHSRHDELHSSNELPDSSQDHHRGNQNSGNGDQASHSLYLQLTEAHHLNPPQNTTQYHSQAYYQHLAAAHYHHGHMHSGQENGYVGPMISHVQQLYGTSNEEPAVGVELEKSQDLGPLDEASAAAHLASLRNTGLRSNGEQEIGGIDGAHLAHAGSNGLEDFSQYEYTDQTHSRQYMAALKKRNWLAAHEGNLDPGVQELFVDPLRVKRKQTRRPDRLCHFENCLVTPTYNYPGEKKRIFCVTHKKEGMVNVVAKRCGHTNCSVNPRFNYEGQTRGLYCSEHKLPDMVNVIDRRCQEPNCKKFPSHNYPGMHKKAFCASHKKDGMICIHINDERLDLG